MQQCAIKLSFRQGLFNASLRFGNIFAAQSERLYQDDLLRGISV